jgi:drug/metabolite transporter (DMT)-like permease
LGCKGIVYVYAFLLRRVPLNIAQVFVSAQVVGVVIASSAAFGELISRVHWLCIACFSFGIFVVGGTATVSGLGSRCDHKGRNTERRPQPGRSFYVKSKHCDQRAVKPSRIDLILARNPDLEPAHQAARG